GWRNRGAAARQKFRLPVRLPAPTCPAGRDAAAPSRTPKSTSLSASVTHCLSVITNVAGAQALAGFQINLDTLAVAPVRLPVFPFTFAKLDFIPHLSQQLRGVGRKPLFDIGDVGGCLVMEAARIHRSLNVHAVIDHT